MAKTNKPRRMALRRALEAHSIVSTFPGVVLDDPRWAAAQELFDEAQLALGCLAGLGPLHANAAQRFCPEAALMLGMAFPQYSHTPESLDRFFGPLDEVLRTVVQDIVFLDPYRFQTEPDRREAEKIIPECAGISESVYQQSALEMKRDVIHLVKDIWDEWGGSRLRPRIRFYDRFRIRKSFPSNCAARFQMEDARGLIMFSTPQMAQAHWIYKHRLPDDIGGLSLSTLVSWDPCFQQSTVGDAGDVATHELMHALSWRPNTTFSPGSAFWKFATATLKGDLPKTIFPAGMALSIDGKNIGHGLFQFNETVTEAAAVELRARLSSPAFERLSSRSRSPWSSALPPDLYLGGRDILDEILPARSSFDLMMSGLITEEFLAGVERRLSPKGASEMIRLLSPDDDLLNEIRSASGGRHLEMYRRMRAILALSDSGQL